MDPLREPDWDRLVASHPQATFFHTASWARTLHAAYGFDCRYIAATDGNQLRALLPLMEARSWLRGPRGVSLPFTDECRVFVSPEVGANDLLAEATRQGIARGWRYLELRGGLDSFDNVPESNSYLGHSVEITGESGQLLANCDSAVRRSIRKAEREGVTVEFGTDFAFLHAYYKLHCRTRARLGAPPQPLRFFEAICEHVLQKAQGFIALAKHQGRPIAGAVIFQFARQAIYKFSASDNRFQHLRGANMVIWAVLGQLLRAGMCELNFGRTSLSNKGLRRFKLGWGSREYMIRYARYSFSPAGFISGKDAADGACTRFLALLPVTASRWLGQVLYPHMT
jgi:hypothetical protein